jgi:dTDP-4-dehydrorhamnose 3,5-epimerase-like enzyme
MAYIIDLLTITDERGSITIAEKALPFEIKRVYWVYQFSAKRGGHRHKKTLQALICINGSCEIFINNGTEKTTVLLDRSNKCLVLSPEDWHTMDGLDENCVLLVMASEHYDKNDYIYEPIIAN